MKLIRQIAVTCSLFSLYCSVSLSQESITIFPSFDGNLLELDKSKNNPPIFS